MTWRTLQTRHTHFRQLLVTEGSKSGRTSRQKQLTSPHSTYEGSGSTIFLLARAAGVDFDFSIAIKYETSANTASKSAMLATLASLYCAARTQRTLVPIPRCVDWQGNREPSCDSHRDVNKVMSSGHVDGLDVRLDVLIFGRSRNLRKWKNNKGSLNTSSQTTNCR